MHSPLPDYAVSSKGSAVPDGNDQEDVLADKIPVTKCCDVEMSLNYQGRRVTRTVSMEKQENKHKATFLLEISYTVSDSSTTIYSNAWTSSSSVTCRITCAWSWWVYILHFEYHFFYSLLRLEHMHARSAKIEISNPLFTMSSRNRISSTKKTNILDGGAGCPPDAAIADSQCIIDSSTHNNFNLPKLLLSHQLQTQAGISSCCLLLLSTVDCPLRTMNKMNVSGRDEEVWQFASATREEAAYLIDKTVVGDDK